MYKPWGLRRSAVLNHSGGENPEPSPAWRSVAVRVHQIVRVRGGRGARLHVSPAPSSPRSANTAMVTHDIFEQLPILRFVRRIVLQDEKSEQDKEMKTTHHIPITVTGQNHAKS
jgi:hypothetical protein